MDLGGDFPVQPGTGKYPHSVCRTWRYSKHLRRLGHGQPGEIAQFDQPRCLRVLGGQPGEGGVELHQVVTEVRSRHRDIVEEDPIPVTAVFRASFPTGGIDENAPHCVGGGSEEVSSAFPHLGLLDIDQPHVRLVNKSGWLQGLARMFLSEASRS